MPEKGAGYSYVLRFTKGPLAGGGTRGWLVPSHGYWIHTKTEGWDE
jgi:hypothetical protein